jgi:hypothetical protein
VNLETERLYFYKQGKDARDWVLDNNPNINLKDPIWSQFSIKKVRAHHSLLSYERERQSPFLSVWR